MELNTQLPTSGMLCGKLKWEAGSVNFPSGSGVIMNDHLHTSVLYGDCQLIHGDAVLTGEAVIPRRDWKPLALALLALTEQEENA